MRFGIATCDITPTAPLRLSGFCARRDVFDSVNDSLTFTALVLEEDGRRMVLGAADILNFPGDGTIGNWLDRVGDAAGCPPENVLLNASHTHGGPLIAIPFLCLSEMYGDAERAYTALLLERVVQTTREAVRRLSEGTLWYAEGTTDFPCNRRRPSGNEILLAPNPTGATDNRLQMLLVMDHTRNLAALGLKMACHPVTTGTRHNVTADFPGAWRAAASAALGDRVVPFFLQGAGADANPRHIAKGDSFVHQPYDALPAMGRALLAQTLHAIVGRALTPVTDLVLRGDVRRVRAPCELTWTDRVDLQRLRDRGNRWERRYAQACLARLDAGESIPDYNDFRVQTVRLARDLVLVGLDAEPSHVVGHEIERALAPARVVVMGYTNGYSGYALDSQEMLRGGYEAEMHLHLCWTGPLKPGLERLLAGAAAAACAGEPRPEER